MTDGCSAPGGTAGSRLPRIVLVLLVTASITVTMAGLRAAASIIGPVFLAAVLTITVHPLRRRMVKRGMPEWLVCLIAVITVYALILGGRFSKGSVGPILGGWATTEYSCGSGTNERSSSRSPCTTGRDASDTSRRRVVRPPSGSPFACSR